MSRRRFLLAFPAVASAALGVVAFAAWSVLGHGTPTVGASMLGTPGSVNASQPTAGVGTVHVTWNGVTGPNGGAVSGYYVQRFSGATPAVACGSSAGSLLPATPTACDDTGVAAGTYTYKVTAVYVSWSATSGASSALTVVLDATPPTTTLTFPSNGSTVSASGYAAGCSTPGVCGTAADSSGVQSVSVSIRQGSGNYWNGSAFASATEVFQPATLGTPGSTSTSWSYPLARPADGAYTVHVQATDTVGNATPSGTYSSSATFTIDSTAPTAPTSVSLVNGQGSGGAWINSNNQSSLSVLVSGISEVSANDSIVVTLSDGTHTVTKTVIAAATNLTVTGINASTLNDGTGNITISAVEKDEVGNTSASRSAATAYSKDTVPPAIAVTSAPVINISNKSSVSSAGTGEVGAAVSVVITDSVHNTSPVTTTVGAGGTWSVSGIDASALTDGTVTYTATATDTAGNSASGSLNSTKDTVAPGAPGSVALANGQGQGAAYINISTKTGVSVTVSSIAEVNASDSVVVTVSDGTHTATGTAAASTSSVTVTGIDASSLNDGTSNITVSAVEKDAAGNSSTAKAGATSYSKDTVAPTVTALTSANGGSTAGKAEQTDSLTVTFSEAILSTSVPATSNVVLSGGNGNNAPSSLSIPGLSAGSFQISTGEQYMTHNKSATFTGSALSQPSSTQVRVTLAACTATTDCASINTASTAFSITFPPSTGLSDLAGNAPTGTLTLSIKLF